MASPSPFPLPSLETPMSPFTAINTYDNIDYGARNRSLSAPMFTPNPIVPSSPMFNTMTDLFPTTPLTGMGDDTTLDSRYSNFSSLPPTTPNSLSVYGPSTAQPPPVASAPSLSGLASSSSTAQTVEKNQSFNLSITISDLYLNRMQWYAMTLKFTDLNGRPLFADKAIRFDESSVFFDARKKAAEDDIVPPSEVVTITLEGLCAETQRALVKCRKCMKKDRNLIMRKRKDDLNRWNDEDDINNQRLIQVVAPLVNAEKIKSDGSFVVKFRVSCCVGVLKQHHENHPSEGSSGTLVLHKLCPGLAIKATAQLTDYPQTASAVTHSLHVLGKVSQFERKQKAEDLPEQEEPEPKQGTKRTRSQAEAELQPKHRTDPKVHQKQARTQQHHVSSREHAEEAIVDHDAESASQSLLDIAAAHRQRELPTITQLPFTSLPARSPMPWATSPTPLTFAPLTPAELRTNDFMGLPSTPMSTVPAVFQAEADATSAALLHKLLRARGHADPASALHLYALRYKKNYDTLFPTPLREVFDPSFFALENLRKIPSESPTMFAVYSILGCITCGMSLELAEDIWSNALKLVAKFSQTDLKWNPKETLLIVDAHNRMATYFGISSTTASLVLLHRAIERRLLGSIGALEKARYFVSTATALLATLPQSSKDGSCKPVYESILWTRSTYSIDFDTLKESLEWAKDCGRMNAQIYSMFGLTVWMCYPDVKRDPNELGFEPSEAVIQFTQRNPLLNLVAQLKELLFNAGYAAVKDGRHTYQPLFDTAFGALESWISGDLIAATSKISASVLPSALLTSPQIEAFIPLYFCAFIALQLAPFDHVHMLDYAELHLRQLMKIQIMRWARNIIDHLIKRLDTLCGEPSGLTWIQLTQENCIQLGLCDDPTVVVKSEPVL